MLRQKMLSRSNPSPTAFRWRGGDVSRLEGFSDAVFGFAITLLIVSLEVPRTFNDLAATIQGFVGFAVCFILLALVWYDHYVFFRAYGLNDTLTVVLNLVLLFLVMFYVYPLKFLFTLLVSMFTGLGGQRHEQIIQQQQFPALMMIYGFGFVSVYSVFAMMWLNAYRQRDALELNEIERFDTKADIGSHVVLIALGVLSLVLAFFGTRWLVVASGLTYWGIGPSMAIYWGIVGRMRKKHEKRAIEMSRDASSTPLSETPPYPP